MAKKIHTTIINFESKIIGSAKPLPYFEPFMGMGSVMAEFGKDNNRELSGCDINKDVILMWKALQNGWEPPCEVSEEYYNELKKTDIPSAERGFVGSACSFGGQYFKGYKKNFDKNTCRNYAKMGCNSIKKVLPFMLKVNILDSASYSSFNPKDKLIYADPPYKNNKIFNKFFQGFNHEEFWNIMRLWSKNNIVIISEQIAPEDFVSIWEEEYKVSFMKKNIDEYTHTNTVKKMTEKLYVHYTLLGIS